MVNQTSMDALCAALAYVMGIDPPEHAAAPAPELIAYMDQCFGGKKADRVVMYNPDAVAQWIFEKYPGLVQEVTEKTDMKLPLRSPMPSVTPVCFATMYTGAQPAVHGIQRYTRPVLTVDTLFDAMIRAGKKVALVSQVNFSTAIIFQNRSMDYFIYNTIAEINAKAAELILQDAYDFILIYNGNYDTRMHKCGPESLEALSELRANSEAFAMFSTMIENHWKHHNTFVGFSMDHGCHEIDGGAGAHGLDVEEDVNVMHLFKAYPAAR